MDLCFHYDLKCRDMWAHLALAYKVPFVHEILCPEEETMAKWLSVSDYLVAPGPRLILSPKDAKYTPGTVALRSLDDPGIWDYTLVLGSNEHSNTFVPQPGDIMAYIDTPDNTPLYALQAAGIALHTMWGLQWP